MESKDKVPIYSDECIKPVGESEYNYILLKYTEYYRTTRLDGDPVAKATYTCDETRCDFRNAFDVIKNSQIYARVDLKMCLIGPYIPLINTRKITWHDN